VRNCNQCGKCCIKYGNGGLSASSKEIEQWETSAPTLLKYVRAGKIWMNPDTGEQLETCPWLRKVPSHNKNCDMYSCDIYDDRPNDCKIYPVTIDEMIRDECEMLEAKDILRPKQAQKELDFLMAESRPDCD